MKLRHLLVLFFLASPTLLLAQAGEWTWVSGVSFTNNAGTFGVQGVPNVTNSPPSVYEACEWKDHAGNFWLYGGLFYTGISSTMGDLWRYNPVTNEWTWMTGTSIQNSPPNYGTRGVAAATNTPGDRGYGSMTWTDMNGNLWLFGGYSISQPGYLNDLWKYDIGTNLWTWMAGDNFTNSNGVYGTQGVASPSNKPPSVAENATSWIDKSNNLWMYGGSGNGGYYGDVWKYDITNNEWTWMKGTGLSGQIAVYGTLQVSNPANMPGSRQSYSHWTNDSTRFWMFGGSGLKNDMWMFDTPTNNWTWMSGPSTTGDPGSLGTRCSTAVTNVPQSRYEHRSSVTDQCGNFWFYGGYNGGATAMMNDLWRYDPVINQWAFIGPTSVSTLPVYGTLGVSNPANTPGSRMGALGWMDAQGNYWMYGGFGNNYVTYGDLWRYTRDSTCGGSSCSVQAIAAHFTSSDTAFCDEAGRCISFFDHSTGNPISWQWRFSGAVPDTSNVQNPTSICYYNPGTYAVTLIVTNGSGLTDTLAVASLIIFETAPPPPTVTAAGDTLTSTHASSYQWYFNGFPISGATDSFYVATQTGTYASRGTDSLGCSGLSNGVYINITSIYEANGWQLKLYPNPAKDKFMIYGFGNKEATIELLNVLGENIYTQKFESNSKSEIQVDVLGLPKGVYFVQAIQDGRIYRARLVKQ